MVWWRLDWPREILDYRTIESLDLEGTFKGHQSNFLQAVDTQKKGVAQAKARTFPEILDWSININKIKTVKTKTCAEFIVYHL